MNWIPVTERLPEPGEPVLMAWPFNGSYVVEVGFLDGTPPPGYEIRWSDSRYNKGMEVRFWQPLPPPPTDIEA